MVSRLNVQGDQRLQGRVAISLGVGGVGFRLVGFAPRDALMLDEILVQIGQPPVGPGGGERLAVCADRRRKVG